ncbi:MAG: M48 family metalloprotease [Chitinophagaceae bacterium]|nr:M48 family metalloprotease [Chitinophagaceae bacterium]
MSSIVFFFIVYIIMIVLSIALSIACVYLGVGLMAVTRHWIGIVAGLGIISIGIMVFIFLVKFIFSVKKTDESKMLTVTEGEQPQLYAFIRQLTNDTQTQFPRKIVLSADVNACVFYNDSFWSMFFPVKKNLQIGLGLVNSLTLSEFKAVMAHEFGHFSQKSMKLGSFVYNVNKVIYNMLYENKDYGKFLSGWGNLHAVISMFVWVTVQLIRGIQKILEGMYSFINKSYMRLSREMEFHADAVAASVSGSNNCISALRKIELSDMCFNTVMQKADMYLQQKEVLENIYAKHNVVMKQYATEFELPMKNNVPIMTDTFLKRFQLSKVNIQNQWASHPSMNDRVERLKQLDIEAMADDQSAWILFNNSERLQKELTAVLYSHLSADMKQTAVSEKLFEERYLTDADNYKLPSAYNGYYDGRQMNEMDFETVFSRPFDLPFGNESLQQRFSDERAAMPRELAALQADAGILEAIIHQQVDTNSFDYDGVKYRQEDAPAVLEKIKAAADILQKQIQQDEETNAAFFYAVAVKAGPEKATELKTKYLRHFANRKRGDEFVLIYQRIYELLGPLLQGQTVTIDVAKTMAGDLWQESIKIKPLLKHFLNNGTIKEGDSTKTVQQFIDADYKYFWTDSFLDGDLSNLQKTINTALDEMGISSLSGLKNYCNTSWIFLSRQEKTNL